MLNSFRDISRLCKENGFQRTDRDTYIKFVRVYGDGIFQVIGLVKEPIRRKILVFGSFSLYGELFTKLSYTYSLHAGDWDTENFAKQMGLPVPTSVEEDYLLFAEYGMPYLNAIQTQQDLIKTKEAKAAADNSMKIPMYDFNLCDAYLHEMELRKAFEQVNMILAQHMGAYSSRVKNVETLEECRKWFAENAPYFRCQDMLFSGEPEVIQRYLDRMNEKNLRLLDAFLQAPITFKRFMSNEEYEQLRLYWAGICTD